jgi:galactonate dehydratase
MGMNDRIAAVETFIVTLPRETPYLGPLAPGEHVNARGYLVRKGNNTIYPTVDRSIVVRVTTTGGAVGWGETYGICAPRATCEIVNDLLAPVLLELDAEPPAAIWDRLYGLMRVRGCTGGFHGDALAALDIALWDLHAQGEGKPLREVLGQPVFDAVPGYVSGLPAATLDERVALALRMQAQGHRAFKFAAVVSNEGIVAEMATLRAALGEEAEILIDLHWKFDAEGALRLIEALAPYRPAFVEAPVAPEDMAGLGRVARDSAVPVAAGEEWYTAYDAFNRLDRAPIAYLQPEMGHTGITQFLRIARLGEARGVLLAPHATIGTGIFLAASLQASAVLPHLWRHEWQHSVFGRGIGLLEGELDYRDNSYRLPGGAGLGVRPGADFWNYAELVA